MSKPSCLPHTWYVYAMYISIAYAFCQYVHKHIYIILFLLQILTWCDIIIKHLFESEIMIQIKNDQICEIGRFLIYNLTNALS